MCSTAGGWALQRAVTLLESRFTRLRLRRQSNPFQLALRLFQAALNSDSWYLSRSEKVREGAILKCTPGLRHRLKGFVAVH